MISDDEARKKFYDKLIFDKLMFDKSEREII